MGKTSLTMTAYNDLLISYSVILHLTCCMEGSIKINYESLVTPNLQNYFAIHPSKIKINNNILNPKS